MAWTYSDWTTLSGPSQLSELALHIKEVSDQITVNYSVGGRSKGVDPLNVYLKDLKDDFRKLGGVMIRANGRRRLTAASFADAGSEGVE